MNTERSLNKNWKQPPNRNNICLNKFQYLFKNGRLGGLHRMSKMPKVSYFQLSFLSTCINNIILHLFTKKHCILLIKQVQNICNYKIKLKSFRLNINLEKLIKFEHIW